MYINIKIANKKKLQLKALVNSEYTHIRINKQLVKEEQIKTKLIDRSFEIFNTDRTKNKEVTRFVLLELEINKYIEKIDATVINLNNIDIFLEYDQLVKYSPEVNQNK